MLRQRLTRFHGLLAAPLLVSLLALLAAPPWLAWFLVGTVVTVAGLLAGLGVAFPRWQMFGHSLCQVSTDRQVVALTFDDGPDPDATPALLDLLGRAGVRATFFCVGERVARHPELVRLIASEGHLIGNHSWAHHRGTNLFSLARLREDLQRAQTEIARVTGKSPEFFRPPMGLTNPRIFRVVRELDLTVIGWSARGFDQREPSPERIVGRLMRGLKPGAILLLHDAGVPGERLRRVVELLIDKLKAHGYQPVRLDELIATAKRT